MKRNQSGFALVTAIFLLVVMFGLGLFMVTLSGTHQATPRQSLLAARVYFGAKAGLEWGIQRSIAVCPPPTTCAACVTCVASTPPFSLSGAGLNGVNVTVTCTCTDHTGGTVHRITSTGITGTYGALDYAQRRMEATVSSIP